jgi:hypothetical protein
MFAIANIFFQKSNMLFKTPATRNLRVTKWLASVPAVAVCTQCGREFKVPLLSLKRTSEAQESLRKQFAEHKCASQVEGK